MLVFFYINLQTYLHCTRNIHNFASYIINLNNITSCNNTHTHIEFRPRPYNI